MPKTNTMLNHQLDDALQHHPFARHTEPILLRHARQRDRSRRTEQPLFQDRDTARVVSRGNNQRPGVAFDDGQLQHECLIAAGKPRPDNDSLRRELIRDRLDGRFFVQLRRRFLDRSLESIQCEDDFVPLAANLDIVTDMLEQLRTAGLCHPVPIESVRDQLP